MTKLYRDVIIIFVAGILLVVFIFAWLIPYLQGLNRPAYLDVLVSDGISVTIDGQEYRSGVYAMNPGEYRAKVHTEGIKDMELDLSLAQGQTTGVYPYFKDGKWDVSTLEELQYQQKIAGALPLELTICNGEATRTNCDAVKVTYERACGSERCLVITGRKAELTEGTLTQIREKLAEKGYNLDNYAYIYKWNSQ